MTTQRLRLEALQVGQLPAIAGRRTDYADTLRRGLVLRVTPRGVRTWVLVYRAGPHVRRYKLGRWPDRSLAAARKAARQARGMVDAGQDPQALRVGARRAREAAREDARAPGATMGRILTRFAEHVLAGDFSASVQRQWPRLIEAELRPALGQLEPADPGLRARVMEAVERVGSRGSPKQANRVLQVARRAWRWGVERGLIPVTAPYPFLAIPMPHRERPRTRFYNPDEIRALWGALGREGPVFAAFGRLLWWTGARSSEVSGMRFEELDTATGRWVKRETKARQPLVLTLPRQARELLELRRTELGVGCVLPAAGGGDGPLLYTSLSRLARRLRKSVPDYRHHDVRRTVRTGLAELGVRYEVAEMILGHVQGRIAETYNRHLYQDEIGEALQRWADRLEEIVKT